MTQESGGVILVIGLLAQLCFAIRQIVQWLASERAKEIQSPVAFWLFSLLGSIFLLVYGLLRLDLAVVLGQIFNFYIHCRNLYFKGVWSRLAKVFQVGILLIPVGILAYLYLYHAETFYTVLDNDSIGSGWLLVGTLGYLLFTLRFVYQWYVSEQKGVSTLPVGFFVMSIVGSIMIVGYGIYRSDVILIFGYFGGLFVYIRNLMINYRSVSK